MLRAEGFPDETIALEQRDRSEEVDEAEMLDELDAMEAGPGLVASKSMMTGLVKGGMVGGILGAILGLAVALVFFPAPGSLGAQTGPFIATVDAFTVAGGTCGGVAGGFLKPRERRSAPDQGEYENLQEIREVVLSIRLDDERALQRAEQLVRDGAVRLDHVGPHGEVMSTERTHADHSPRGTIADTGGRDKGPHRSSIPGEGKARGKGASSPFRALADHVKAM
jgi:hypothetical protein